MSKLETKYHDDMTCGACDGRLETDRSAVCHTCTPESDWFRMAAFAQFVQEMSEEEE